MAEWINVFNNAKLLSLLSRIAILLAVIPQGIKAIIWLFVWTCKILYFCFGWLLPTYISKGKIRSYEFGPEYWLVVPMLTVFANRYCWGFFAFLYGFAAFAYRWTIGMLPGDSTVVQNSDQTTQATYNTPSHVTDTLSNLSPASVEVLTAAYNYLTDLHYLIPMIVALSVVKLVQLPEIQDEGWWLIILLAGLVSAGLAFNYGYLHESISYIKPHYDRDPNLFIAWVIFIWFVCLYSLKRFSTFTTYNPVNGNLSRYNNTLIGKKQGHGDGRSQSVFIASPFEIKMRSWLSYLLLCGGLDYTSEIEDDHQQNFGLGVALFIWSCIYDDVQVVDGKPPRKKFSIFNRTQYYGQDFGLDKAKKSRRLASSESPVDKPKANGDTSNKSPTEVDPAITTATSESTTAQVQPIKPLGRIAKFFQQFIKKR